MTLPIHSGLVNSPLWYLANVMDTLEWNYDDKCGIFYFGSRNQIYFIKVTEIVDKSKFNKNTFEPKVLFYMKAHHEHIVGLCTIYNGLLMPFKDEKLLPRFVSCGKDKIIRIWSFNEEKGCCCLKEFNLSSTKITTNPTCISVSSSNIVLCGFEKGHLLTWNYCVESESKSFFTMNEDIILTSWKENKFAVGFKKGFVHIYAYNSYDCISKLTQFRAHNADVCNISWNPIMENVDLWGDLATSGKDRKVKLWKVDKNFNLKTLILPSTYKKANRDSDEKEGSSNSNWSSICWSSAIGGSIIVSNSLGNVGVWKSPSSTELKYFSQNNQTKIHTKSVFGLVQFVDKPGLILSHSMDRLINISQLDESSGDGEYVHSMSCLGGSVLSLSMVAHSNHLAIGCADNLIRLWRPDTTLRRSDDVTNVWNGINGKILAVSWHPLREGLLAFGTETGEVGCLKTAKDKKICDPSNLLHQNKVFVTTWGVDIRGKDCGGWASEEDMRDNLCIYSIGNYCLLMHDFPRKKFCDVSHLVKTDESVPRVTEFVFHESLRFFAVGYSSGLVAVFALRKDGGGLVKLCHIRTHTKSINCIRWSPRVNTDGATVTYRLAIGSNERFVTVTDLDKIVADFEARETGDIQCVDFTDSLVQFKGHGDRITGIDWCPFDPDRLVTSSYDWTAIVWSIRTRVATACFTGHQGKVLCCHWSDRDPDLVYSGGEDCNLWSWRPSQQSPPAEMHKRRNFIAHVPGLSNSAVIDSKKSATVIDNCVQDEDSLKPKPELHLEPTVSKQRTFIKKRKSLFPTTLFAVHHSLDTYQHAIIDMVAATKDTNRSVLPCLAPFSYRAGLVFQIEQELIHHRQDNNLDNYFILLLWLGRTGRVATECVAINYTPDWLALALMAVTARDFADDLLTTVATNIATGTRQDPVLGATLLLARNRSHAAIDLLVRNNCVPEALVLAQLRLAPTDPLISQLLVSRRDKLLIDGNFEMAAACCWRIGDWRGLIQALGRRSTRLAQWVAIDILVHSQQLELAHECISHFISGLLLDGTADHNQWIDKIRSVPYISIYATLFDLHHYLWVESKNLEEIMNLLIVNLNQYSNHTVSMMRCEIQSKLMTKQTSQLENQILLYLTFEIMVLILCRMEPISQDNVDICHQLKDLIRQLHNINSGGQKFIKQLIGDDQNNQNEIISLMTESLSNLKL